VQSGTFRALISFLTANRSTSSANRSILDANPANAPAIRLDPARQSVVLHAISNPRVLIGLRNDVRSPLRAFRAAGSHFRTTLAFDRVRAARPNRAGIGLAERRP